jgi:hypothetical protein
MTTGSYKILESKTQGITTIERWDNGIVFIRTEDHSQMDADDVSFHFEYILSLGVKNNSLKILTEPGLYSSISKEARELSAKPEMNKFTLGSAVVVKSVAQRLLINFIITFTHKQQMKMKIFDSREKAIDWLMSLS